MIGVWFLVDAQFKSKRLIKLYSELWFYTATITIVLLIFRIPVSAKNIIGGFLPFLRRSCWFVPTYLVLIALSPFINFVTKWSRKTHQTLLVLLTFIGTFISTVSGFMDTWFDCIFWFVYIYFFIGYYKTFVHAEDNRIKKNKGLLLFIGLLTYFLLVGINYYGDFVSQNRLAVLGSKVAEQYLSDYKSLPNLIISFCIFNFFINTDIGEKNIINTAARSSLAVYLIHQTPALIPIIWTQIFRCNDWVNSKFYLLYFIGVVLMTYLGGFLVDLIRFYIIEPKWMSSKSVDKVEKVIDKFYKPLLKV